jgi:alkanesulfonate monooxygenase SsuD/methylene tetrahydromethanopterin reductase-like flavin-dependent oxidoreductase (luciferase family)
MRKVWAGEVVDHRSDFLNWQGFKSYPLPIQKPMPVIIGGAKGKVYQRIARHGDGWFAPIPDPAELGKALGELKSACKAEGRNYAEIEITTMWAPPAGLDSIKRLQDLGVARVTVFGAAAGDPVEAIKKIGDEVIAKL